MTKTYHPHQPLDRAIGAILSGQWVEPKLRAYMAPSYANKVQVIQSGEDLLIVCACGRSNVQRFLSASMCPWDQCGLIFVVTYRHILVSWGLDQDTEDKMAVIRQGFFTLPPTAKVVQ